MAEHLNEMELAFLDICGIAAELIPDDEALQGDLLNQIEHDQISYTNAKFRLESALNLK